MGLFIVKNDRVNRLTKLCREVLENRAGKKEILNVNDEIAVLNPIELISVVENIIGDNSDIEVTKKNLSKSLNVLHIYIKNYKWSLHSENLFLKDMINENSVLRIKLDLLKKQIQEKFKGGNPQKINENELNDFMNDLLELEDIDAHYLKMENIFFPYLEKNGGNLKCLKIMWSIHDDVRRNLQNIRHLKENNDKNMKELIIIVGELFFSMYALILREEFILYPAASEILEKNLWGLMYDESFDIGFSFIKSPVKETFSETSDHLVKNNLIDTGSGILDPETLKLILNSLPLDITFVDENDKVAYFSQPRHRIFTRSKGIIGREVQNCHPPESLDRVNTIIESFKNGSSSKESFRIFLNNRYILIEYFALRDKSDRYRGTLEVTSDITEINQFEGEKRL